MERWQELTQQKSPAELWANLRTGKFWFIVAAITAFAASSIFSVTYFVGGNLDVSTWSNEHYYNAALGIGITATVTGFQYYLYSIKSNDAKYLTMLAVAIAVFFGMFSEISHSLNREDAAVSWKSQQSPVFQALLEKLSAPANLNIGVESRIASAQAELADAQYELSRCDRHASKGQKRVERCEVYETKRIHQAEGTIAGYQAQMQTKINANQQHQDKQLETAREMEHDEAKHYSMIRLLMQTFGISAIAASFLFSLIIIGTFEFAFHFVGGYVNDVKLALHNLGYETGKYKKMPPKLQSAQGDSTQSGVNQAATNNYNINPQQVGGLSLNTTPTATTGTTMPGMGFAPSQNQPAKPEKQPVPPALKGTLLDELVQQGHKINMPTGDLNWATREAHRRYMSNPDRHIPGENLKDWAKRIAKQGAEKGIETGIKKAAELNTIANGTAQTNTMAAANFVETVADKFKQRPTSIDPRWLKAAKLPEFPSVFTAIVTGECPPVQNQIAVKRKLCGNHKAVQIMELMWIYHWLDKVEKTGRFKLPEQHDRLKLALPITEQQAQRHIKIIKALAEKDTETEEKAA